MGTSELTKTPLISIILATYNRANLLPRAISSVLTQTYQNFELIVINDGSTDSIEEVVRSFNDRRIVYYKHPENKGVLAARNTGFDLSKGKYLVLLDDDDELLPEALETVVKKFEELLPKGIKIIWFDSIDVEKGKISGYGIEKEGLVTYRDYICGKIHGDYWIVFCRDVIGEDRFDERLWGHESILWLKLHRKSKAFYFQKVLCEKYREHGKRMCDFENRIKHLSEIILSQEKFLQEHGKEIRHLCSKYYGERLAYLGLHQLLNGDTKGRRSILKSLRFRFSFKYLSLFLLSFLLSKSQLLSIYYIYTNRSSLKG